MDNDNIGQQQIDTNDGDDYGDEYWNSGPVLL